MCGRYTFVLPSDFYSHLEIENRDLQLKANYNVVPGEIMPVVVANSPKRVEHMKWGLIPYWAKDPAIGYRLINARAEGISVKPSFRRLLRNQRCLIPAVGFYEWQKSADKQKRPYFIKLKSREWFVFAGLYDIWKTDDESEIKTYTIITTGANSLVGKIHDRMPVILKTEDEERWADNSTYLINLLSLLKPYPAKEMEMHIVSRKVNDPRNNSSDLLGRVG